jgi:putative endonuclease
MNKAGKKGEDKAVAALEKAGMRIVGRNVRSRRGEVDIVAFDDKTLVFVEVKAYKTFGVECLQYSIDGRKQGRIIETARDFLYKHPEFEDVAIRFDVVFVGNKDITHLASAFVEEL